LLREGTVETNEDDEDDDDGGFGGSDTEEKITGSTAGEKVGAGRESDEEKGENDVDGE
jgi:hypothetical protein